MAANALRALLLFVGLLFALSAAGIDLTALCVLGGALGVGIGFGLQKLAANYVSGFVILAERSMRIGDMVKVDSFEGRITDIRTRYTVIRALNGREAIVPNEMLITQRVENFVAGRPEACCSTTTVQVAYGTDLAALMPRLRGGGRRGAARARRPGAGGAAGGLRRRRPGADDRASGSPTPRTARATCARDVNLAVLRALDEPGSRFRSRNA